MSEAPSNADHPHGLPAYQKNSLHAPIIPSDQVGELRAALDGFTPVSGAEFDIDNVALIFPPDRFEKSTMKQIGGYDMTRRTLDDIEGYIPGITEQLDKETGKIIILGNGLSPLAADIGDRFAKGQFVESPVVVDLIDYDKLLQDLEEIDKRFQEKNLLNPYADDLKTIARIVEVKQAGHIRTEVYMVGSGVPPGNLSDASLIINAQGPSLRTLAEQVSYLTSGGTLALSESLKGVDTSTLENVTVVPLGKSSAVGFLITKNK